MSNLERVKHSIISQINLDAYSKVEILQMWPKDDDFADFGIELYQTELLTLDQPFSLFNPEEINLLTTRNIRLLDKFVSFQGVQGYLHLGYTTADWLSSIPKISPWLASGTNIDEQLEFPIEVIGCFNDTNRKAPIFRLSFPESVKPNFIMQVVDWDVVHDTYDATLGVLEASNPKEVVQLLMPLDATKLVGLRVTATSEFIGYPHLPVGYN